MTFDANTAVGVTGTIDYASSDGNGILSILGVCYAPTGTTNLTLDESVAPEFTAPANSYFAQTVSDIVGDLTPGTYDVGLCTSFESANVLHGAMQVSSFVAETQSGVSYFSPKLTPKAVVSKVRQQQR